MEELNSKPSSAPPPRPAFLPPMEELNMGRIQKALFDPRIFLPPMEELNRRWLDGVGALPIFLPPMEELNG